MVGIVILNYNNWKDTEECVRSILEKELRTDYQIYLVDNADGGLRPFHAALRFRL